MVGDLLLSGGDDNKIGQASVSLDCDQCSDASNQICSCDDSIVEHPNTLQLNSDVVPKQCDLTDVCANGFQEHPITNECVIPLTKLELQCVKTYDGHTNEVYSLITIPAAKKGDPDSIISAASNGELKKKEWNEVTR